MASYHSKVSEASGSDSAVISEPPTSSQRAGSLTQLHCDVYVSSSESEYAGTLLSAVSPVHSITKVSEKSTLKSRQRPLEIQDHRTHKRGSLGKLKRSVSKSKQKIIQLDTSIRKKAQGTLQRMRSLRTRDDVSDNLTSGTEDSRPNSPPMTTISSSITVASNVSATSEPVTSSSVFSTPTSTIPGSLTVASNVSAACESATSSSLFSTPTSTIPGSLNVASNVSAACESATSSSVFSSPVAATTTPRFNEVQYTTQQEGSNRTGRPIEVIESQEQNNDSLSGRSQGATGPCSGLSDAELVTALVSITYSRGKNPTNSSTHMQESSTNDSSSKTQDGIQRRWLTEGLSENSLQQSRSRESLTDTVRALEISLENIGNSQKQMKPLLVGNFTTQLQPTDAHDDKVCEFVPKNVEQICSAQNEIGDKFEHLYKILIIGELGTGKTSIIKRYVHQFFSSHYRATIGVDFALKVLHWDANTVIRLQLWDIAGQERFGSMTRVYYKEAVAAFIVFDVSRATTFDAVMKWKHDLDDKVQLPNGEPVPCVLLANKCDLDKEGLVANPERMTEWVEQNGFVGWHETSAKENLGIEHATHQLITRILSHEKSGDLSMSAEGPDILDITEGRLDSNKCSC